MRELLGRKDSPPSRQEILALAGLLEEIIARTEAAEKQEGRRYAALERRLLDIESSRFLRALQWPGRFFADWRGRLGQSLLHSPLHPLYLKLVNASSDPQPLDIDLEGAKLAATAKLVGLQAHDTQETNSIDSPERIVPVETALHNVSSHLHHTIPGYAIQVIEFDEQ